MYCNSLRLDKTVLAIDRSPSMQRELPHRQYSIRVGEREVLHGLSHNRPLPQHPQALNQGAWRAAHAVGHMHAWTA